MAMNGKASGSTCETGASVDPLRPDLVADDELAKAGGSAEELLCGLVVLGGAQSLPFLGVGSGHGDATV
jgi:hypothetical protein